MCEKRQWKGTRFKKVANLFRILFFRLAAFFLDRESKNNFNIILRELVKHIGANGTKNSWEWWIHQNKLAKHWKRGHHCRHHQKQQWIQVNWGVVTIYLFEFEDYIRCEFCGRSFNKNAAERHIEFCKEQSLRKGTMAGKRQNSSTSNCE